MEITKTFANTFYDMMRAKMRWFLRRSLFRYAIAIALITLGIHGSDATLGFGDKVTRGIIYFVALCVGVFVLHIVVAAIQSRRIAPRTITFTENNLIVKHKGGSAHCGWDWIIAAEESSTTIALLVQRLPRLELYLPKSKLSEVECRVLRGWLVSHGKLPQTDAVGRKTGQVQLATPDLESAGRPKNS